MAEIHTYTVELSGNGLAFRIGLVPKRIWRYVETECGGSAYTYWKRWGDDLPKTMQLWKGDGSSDALDQLLGDDWKYRDRFLAKIDACIPDGSWISVSDEDGNSVYEADFHEDAYGEVFFDEAGNVPKIVHSEAKFPQSERRGNFLFCLATLYRGTWAKCEFEASQFDPSKLAIGLCTILCDPYGEGVTYIDNIEYDGDSIGDVIDNEWQDVDWKDDGSLEFYDATPPDVEKLVKLEGSQLAGLLARQPEFADKCRWSKLNGVDWVCLLAKQPQFAAKCRWKKLDGYDWAQLLRWHPQFADKCDWAKLEDENWSSLLEKQPQFANKRGKRPPRAN